MQQAAGPASEPSRRTSTVASRLASTWTYEDGTSPPDRTATAPVDPVDDEMAPSPARAPSPPRAATAPVAAYWIRVLSGPNAGRELSLTRDECSVGRVGTQVARIAQKDGRWRLNLVEGAAPVVLNGTPVPAEGTVLTPGDRFEVAGVELAFERR